MGMRRGTLVLRLWNGRFMRAGRDIRLARLEDDTALLEWWTRDDALGGERTYTLDELHLIPGHIEGLKAGHDGWTDLTGIAE